MSALLAIAASALAIPAARLLTRPSPTEHAAGRNSIARLAARYSAYAASTSILAFAPSLLAWNLIPGSFDDGTALAIFITQVGLLGLLGVLYLSIPAYIAASIHIIKLARRTHDPRSLRTALVCPFLIPVTPVLGAMISGAILPIDIFLVPISLTLAPAIAALALNTLRRTLKRLAHNAEPPPPTPTPINPPEAPAPHADADAQ